MNSHTYLPKSKGPEIEDSVILEFMIKRWNEILQSGGTTVPDALQILAAAALTTDEELLINYKALLYSPNLAPVEIMRRCVEIFQEARDSCTGQCPPCSHEKEDGDGPNLGEKQFRQIMLTAISEGGLMERESNYQFHPVFTMLAWISLQYDAEWLDEFERMWGFYREDPEKLVREGVDILKEAFIGWRPSDRLRPLCN
jgi:hypothetical protein